MDASRKGGHDWANSLAPMQLKDVPRVPLPDWALSVAPGANPDFASPLVTLHLSSPTQPLVACVFDLETGAFLPSDASGALGGADLLSPPCAKTVASDTGAGRGTASGVSQRHMVTRFEVRSAPDTSRIYA